MRQLNYKHPFSKQRGVTLIEVLMSVLLMAIIGLGSAFIAARTAVTHRDQNVHLHTISQMRNQLEASQCITDGTTKTITVATTDVNLDCTYTTGNYTVAANGSGGGIASTNTGEIKVKFPALKVQNNTNNNVFVPIPADIKPY
ncbi:PulJ/GspJ family protein [Acinetobacter schindleri]|uniref:PulJ/GspJ family protein n=1 Tax=Acinetobacter schindleri TaxID=108981 RepID=UPI0030F6483F